MSMKTSVKNRPAEVSAKADIESASQSNSRIEQFNANFGLGETTRGNGITLGKVIKG